MALYWAENRGISSRFSSVGRAKDCNGNASKSLGHRIEPGNREYFFEKVRKILFSTRNAFTKK